MAFCFSAGYRAYLKRQASEARSFGVTLEAAESRCCSQDSQEGRPGLFVTGKIQLSRPTRSRARFFRDLPDGSGLGAWTKPTRNLQCSIRLEVSLAPLELAQTAEVERASLLPYAFVRVDLVPLAA